MFEFGIYLNNQELDVPLASSRKRNLVKLLQIRRMINLALG